MANFKLPKVGDRKGPWTVEEVHSEFPAMRVTNLATGEDYRDAGTNGRVYAAGGDPECPEMTVEFSIEEWEALEG